MLRTGAVLMCVCVLAAQPAARQTPALTDLLEIYLKGQYDTAVSAASAQDLSRFRLRYVQDVPAWIGSDQANAGRRGAAAAAFLLELAHARLETDWHRFTDLIEAVCVNLRRSPTPTQFELAWHQASIAPRPPVRPPARRRTSRTAWRVSPRTPRCNWPASSRGRGDATPSLSGTTATMTS